MTQRSRFAVALLALPALAGSPLGTSGQTTYTIDPAASHVVVHVDKSGLFSFAGHAHEVAAPVATGTIVVPPGNPAQSAVRIEFDAAALKVTGKGEPAGDVPDVQRTMESDRVLDVARFGRITFVSRTIDMLGPASPHLRLRLAGDLTLHGVTRPSMVEVNVDILPDRLTATGTLTIRQTAFGIEPVTAAGGTVRVKDEVEVEFTLVGRSGPADR